MCRYLFHHLAQKLFYVLRISFGDIVHIRNQEWKNEGQIEGINECHCIPILPQGSKDSQYDVTNKPLSPEFQHQHFVCSIVLTTEAPVSSLLAA